MNRVMLWAGPAFVMGLVLIESGTYIQRGVPAWLLAVPLAIACGGVLVRQRALHTAGAGRRTAGGRCRRLDASRAGGAGLHRSRVVQRGDRRRARHGEATTKTHVSRVLDKLGLKSRVQAAIHYSEGL
ncbi:hypothetical protein [Nonomuraea maritima]